MPSLRRIPRWAALLVAVIALQRVGQAQLSCVQVTDTWPSQSQQRSIVLRNRCHADITALEYTYFAPSGERVSGFATDLLPLLVYDIPNKDIFRRNSTYLIDASEVLPAYTLQVTALIFRDGTFLGEKSSVEVLMRMRRERVEQTRRALALVRSQEQRDGALSPRAVRDGGPAEKGENLALLRRLASCYRVLGRTNHEQCLEAEQKRLEGLLALDEGHLAIRPLGEQR